MLHTFFLAAATACWVLTIFGVCVLALLAFRGWVKSQQKDRQAMIGLVLMLLLVIASVASFLLIRQNSVTEKMQVALSLALLSLAVNGWTTPAGPIRKQPQNRLFRGLLIVWTVCGVAALVLGVFGLIFGL
ncbi:MAG: hypothetical protein ACJ788_20450 [Ktedonobacteraceae bacterium]|jgi:uncharacterized membrane protein